MTKLAPNFFVKANSSAMSKVFHQDKFIIDLQSLMSVHCHQITKINEILPFLDIKYFIINKIFN